MEMKKPEVKKIPCPYCKEEIIKTASVCKHCHTDFCSIDDKRKILHFIWYLLIIPALIACIYLVLQAIALGVKLCRGSF